MKCTGYFWVMLYTSSWHSFIPKGQLKTYALLRSHIKLTLTMQIVGLSSGRALSEGRDGAEQYVDWLRFAQSFRSA